MKHGDPNQPAGPAHGDPHERGQKIDPDCICHGNWRAIVKRSEPLLGKRFNSERDGPGWTFFGVIHGDDDYYYGMYRDGKYQLLSCVGSLEGWGFTVDADQFDNPLATR